MREKGKRKQTNYKYSRSQLEMILFGLLEGSIKCIDPLIHWKRQSATNILLMTRVATTNDRGRTWAGSSSIYFDKIEKRDRTECCIYQPFIDRLPDLLDEPNN